MFSGTAAAVAVSDALGGLFRESGMQWWRCSHWDTSRLSKISFNGQLPGRSESCPFLPDLPIKRRS
jgi:hypothetical protein